jgi:transposase
MPRADLRKTLNSVLYILINGCRWADLPRNTDIYTSKSSAHRAATVPTSCTSPVNMGGRVAYSFSEI